ncbi:MAG: hypothetical protein J0L58_18325 [Burkholderiales bacterium]|nr:hypothetical protein [Burkholderiales bacterium]
MDEIDRYVRARLSGQGAPPAVEARGEPVWAVLEVAFDAWRANPTQLAAFNVAMADLMQTALRDPQDLPSLAQACRLAANLAALHQGWSLPLEASLRADLQSFALHTDPTKDSSVAQEAGMAALDMLAALNQLDAVALEAAFERAAKGHKADDKTLEPTHQHLLLLGKALLGAQSGQSRTIKEKLWRRLFESFWPDTAGAGRQLVQDFLFWARVVAKEPQLRRELASQAMDAVETADLSRLESACLAQRIVNRFDGVEWPEDTRPQSNADLRNKGLLKRSTQRPGAHRPQQYSLRP